jgi:hypothetical protein
VITELGVGEALVSTLDPKGVPSVVERTLIRPPSSRLGPEPRRTRSGFELPDFGRDDRPKTRRRTTTRRSRSDSVVETAAKSVARSLGSALGRALVRGIMGSWKRGF